MCTAINFKKKYNYFGRNFDFEYTFSEQVTICPRNYKIRFTNGKICENHFAVIGMAKVVEDYPLYFDATNEKGVSAAALNFPHFAKYTTKKQDKDNVASFEFILWVLADCENISQVKEKLKNVNITKEAFNKELEPTPLHWIITDKTESITVEQTEKGFFCYHNPVGVLTNSPDFEKQLFYLNNFLGLSAKEPHNTFSEKLDLKAYSRGMGGIGLPGDLSSMSRFVRASFVKLNSMCGENETEAVSQMFHILYSVYQQRGCSFSSYGAEITNYTSCCNTDKGIYYYTTYNNLSVNAVDMHKENLNKDELITFNLIKTKSFHKQN